jgi:predicted permease
MAPALSFARTDPARWVQGTRGETRRPFRAHNVIVAGDVALAILLVAGASLFGETLLRLTSEAVGFRPEHVAVASVRVPFDPAATAPVRAARWDDLVAQLAALPGVDAAAATSSAPFSNSGGSNGITIDDKPGLKAESARLVVTQGYFRAVGLPVIKGRPFAATDAPGAFVAIVTREFEQRFLDGEGIGKRFTLNNNSHEVVGVVPDARHRRYSDVPAPVFYVLNRQLPTWSTQHLVVRATADPRALLPAIRKTIAAAQPSWSVVTSELMTDMIRRSAAEERFRATLSVAFGLTALLLAGLGLYGLIARLVSDRRREIGVRLALGAQRGSVLRLVMRHAMALVAGGVVSGVPAAIGASTLVGSMLYGVTPTAPHTFLLAIGCLAAVAIAAAAFPALRAARTDPAVVLRTD